MALYPRFNWFLNKIFDEIGDLMKLMLHLIENRRYSLIVLQNEFDLKLLTVIFKQLGLQDVVYLTLVICLLVELKYR